MTHSVQIGNLELFHGTKNPLDKIRDSINKREMKWSVLIEKFDVQIKECE